MCFIPFKARGDNGTREYGLTERDAAGCGRVKTTKWVKWVPLDRCSIDGLVHEAEIEVGIVSDQDGSAATGITNGQPDFAEYTL